MFLQGRPESRLHLLVEMRHQEHRQRVQREGFRAFRDHPSLRGSSVGIHPSSKVHLRSPCQEIPQIGPFAFAAIATASGIGVGQVAAVASHQVVSDAVQVIGEEHGTMDQSHKRVRLESQSYKLTCSASLRSRCCSVKARPTPPERSFSL